MKPAQVCRDDVSVEQSEGGQSDSGSPHFIILYALLEAQHKLWAHCFKGDICITALCRSVSGGGNKLKF